MFRCAHLFLDSIVERSLVFFHKADQSRRTYPCVWDPPTTGACCNAFHIPPVIPRTTSLRDAIESRRDATRRAWKEEEEQCPANLTRTPLRPPPRPPRSSLPWSAAQLHHPLWPTSASTVTCRRSRAEHLPDMPLSMSVPDPLARKRAPGDNITSASSSARGPQPPARPPEPMGPPQTMESPESTRPPMRSPNSCGRRSPCRKAWGCWSPG